MNNCDFSQKQKSGVLFVRKGFFFTFINTAMILSAGCSVPSDKLSYMPRGCIAYDGSYEYCSVNFGDTISITGSGAWVEDGVVSITKGGEYSLTGILSGGSIYINTNGSVKLVLNNVSVVSNGSPAVHCESAEALYIETVSDTTNSLSVSVEESGEEDISPVIYSSADIYFQGMGKLAVDAESGSGVGCLSSIHFNSTDMCVKASASGFLAEKGIIISGGKLRVTAEENFCSPSMNISGGIINGIDYSVKPQAATTFYR